jgi:transcriptional regulator with GAF, ATPase, and Fis domain
MKGFKRLIGNSSSFGTVIRSAQVVAATDVTVLILGESGTGKELLARAIHEESNRRAQPFVTINCGALPEALAESELFGHRKGAFTGAVTDNQGRIRLANRGTVFLDEVGELPASIQVKLLRFLENGECQAIGDTKAIKVNVRLVAATNRDLYEEVKAGKFRKDLYYRLHVVPLELPPLRNRESDLIFLLNHFTTLLSDYHGLQVPLYSDESKKLLINYSWPGNIRELRNFCERMVALYSGRTIYPELLPLEITSGENEKSLYNDGFILPDKGINLNKLEEQLIRQAIIKSKGNRSKAARLLGLTRNTLLYRITKYAIDL